MDRPDLIASDVDGTLLTPMERMSRRTLAVLGRVLGTEVPFVLVSGRPPRWIPPVAAQADITGYAVCANGAALYDIGTDKVLSVRGLDAIALHDVADAVLTALPGAHLAAERVGETAHDQNAPQFVAEPEFRNPWNGASPPHGEGESEPVSRAAVVGKKAIKLLVSNGGMTSDEMAHAAREVLGDAVDITFSTNAGLIEISAPNVTKASGLAEVAALADVAQRDVIAFGDMPNDVEMLRWAGHGVAMANGHPAVLASADEIAAPNTEDGVAQVLERWF
ncbi:MAG: HAD hydrolase family protein [Actinophytocola sp.]|nr:HAD hydrolase family protein [Actinophytocola sp.]